MIISDGQWTVLKPALDAARDRGQGGRPLGEERRTIEAIAWRMRNGARWRAVPAELGPWWKAAQLHIRWSRAGVWQRLFRLLRDAGRAELAEVFLDGSSIRAHHKAAGAKGGRSGTALAARAAAGARSCASPATAAAGR